MADNLRLWVLAELPSRLQIDDEALADYVAGIAVDFDMDPVEKREAVSEFLSAATTVSLDDFLQALFDRIEFCKQQVLALKEEELQRSKLAAKELEKSVLTADAALMAAEVAPKPVMSAEDRKLRQRLLDQYAYDADEMVENEDGEVEILYKDHSADSSAISDASLVANDNAKKVQMAELDKRVKSKEDHAKKVAREKELKEKERLEREKERQRTSKKERRRG